MECGTLVDSGSTKGGAWWSEDVALSCKQAHA